MSPSLPSVDLRRVRHVVFDFDGTLSLLTGGWSEIMADLFLEHLPLHAGEDGAGRRRFALREILQLNGKPSLQQMLRLAELVVERGGTAADAREYHDIYVERLRDVVRERRAAVQGRRVTPDAMLVPGARAFLEVLRSRQLGLTLLSGSPLSVVRKEAALLGLVEYFAERILGPDGDADSFTKRAALEKILSREALRGEELLAFGDGPVEIEHTRALGGIAIGIACDEAAPLAGQIDQAKQELLAAAGANAILPDFRGAPALFARSFKEANEGNEGRSR